MSIRDTLASIGRLAEFRTAKQRAGDKKRAAKLRGRKRGNRGLSVLLLDNKDVKAIKTGGKARKGFKRRLLLKGAAGGALIGSAVGAYQARGQKPSEIIKRSATTGAKLAVAGGVATAGGALLNKSVNRMLRKRKKRRKRR